MAVLYALFQNCVSERLVIRVTGFFYTELLVHG